MAQESPQLYHEKQKLMRCALHTLNNLLQEEAFTKQQLDRIAISFSPGGWINPHKNAFGLGNYDVNVIMAALQSKGFTVKWWDKRNDLGQLDFDKVEGLIVNYATFKFLSLWENRHWFSLRKIPQNTGKWFSFDSNLDEPIAFNNTNELKDYLKDFLVNKRGELLLVQQATTE